MRAILAMLLALAAMAGGAAAQPAPKRVALVIGNAAYTQNALRNPVNDARAMAQTLRQAGFQVIARENATKQQMEQAVGEFGRQLRPGTVALFYYAGHGIQANGRNFLVPVDAKVENEQALRLETLDVDLVLDQVAAAGSDVNLVILDACRNNPFERRFRSGGGGGLAQINAPKGTMIAYSTAPGSVAADGDGANGLYTAKLVEAMRVPGLSLEEVFKKVRAEVARDSKDQQTPWEASSLVGNFYFLGPTTVTVAPAAAPGTVDREALHWQSVKDSTSPAELQSYLDQYPKGDFAGLARARLATLQQPPAAAPQQAAAPVPNGGKFDGVYAGRYACAESNDPKLSAAIQKAWAVSTARFEIRGTRLTGYRKWVQSPTGKTGVDNFTGDVTQDGRVTIAGKGTFDNSQLGYDMHFTAKVADGKLSGQGTHAQRACTLDFTRTAN